MPPPASSTATAAPPMIGVDDDDPVSARSGEPRARGGHGGCGLRGLPTRGGTRLRRPGGRRLRRGRLTRDRLGRGRRGAGLLVAHVRRLLVVDGVLAVAVGVLDDQSDGHRLVVLGKRQLLVELTAERLGGQQVLAVHGDRHRVGNVARVVGEVNSHLGAGHGPGGGVSRGRTGGDDASGQTDDRSGHECSRATPRSPGYGHGFFLQIRLIAEMAVGRTVLPSSRNGAVTPCVRRRTNSGHGPATSGGVGGPRITLPSDPA
ncbi:hypothetical protein SGRI78S_03001 [Streptomyces griseus subsp. griseus]